MKTYSEKWGKNVEEATQRALDELNRTIDQVDVTVLQEPSDGFLGLGSVMAKVRVEIKSTVMDKENLTPPIAQENKQNSSEEKSGSATGKVIAAIIICILLFSAVYGLGGGCEPIVVDVPVKVEGEIKIVPIEEN